jgi:TRAP-type C4-dicarboxylate transport system permease small subunit
MVRPALEILKKAEAAAGAIFFIGMLGAISIQIFSRYVLKHPLVWPFELSIYCFIYITYLGAGIAARRDTHVAFDVVFERFPERAQVLIRILTNLFIIAVLIIVFPPTISYIKAVGYVKSSALGIPWSWVLLSFPSGIALVAIHLSAHTVGDMIRLARKG